VRKTMICLMMIFYFLGIGLGQGQPQWKVVRTVILNEQTATIPPTEIFTAKTPGLYRIGAYMGGGGKGFGTWVLSLAWTDLYEVTGGGGAQCNWGRGGCWGEQSPVLFVPKPQVPVTYEVKCVQGTCTDFRYRIVVTVEQLQ